MAIDTSSYSLKNLYAKARELFSQAAPLAGKVTSAITNEATNLANPVQATQQVGKFISGLPINGSTYGQMVGDAYRETPQAMFNSMSKHQYSAPLASITRNITTPLSSSFSDIATGMSLQNSSDSMTRAKGGAQVFSGAGKAYASVNPLTYAAIGANQLLPQGALKRATTGLIRGYTQSDISPETQTKNINTPFGSFDPLLEGGKMATYALNPSNKALFGMTESALPASFSVAKNGIPKAVAKWIGSNGLRGSIEQIILSLPDMPDNLDAKGKTAWLAQNAALGAVSEIASRGALAGISAVSSKGKDALSGVDQSQVFDWLKGQKQEVAKVAQKAMKSIVVEPGYSLTTPDGRIIGGLTKPEMADWIARFDKNNIKYEVGFNETRTMARVPGFFAGSAAVDFKPDTPGTFSNLMDKKVRFEVDDSGAKLKTTDKWLSALNGEPVDLGSLLDHKELFNNYPDLKDNTIVKFADTNGRGSIRSENGVNFLTLDKKLFNKNFDKDTKSTLLHEIQHAIQQKEGFASGGSPDSFASITELRNDNQNLKSGLFEVDQELEKAIDLGYSNSVIASLKKQKTDLTNQLDGIQQQLSSYLDPSTQYQRLAGEIESRAVQRRMDMPQSQRLTTDPYSAEMTATGITRPQDAIVRFDDGVSQSAKVGGEAPTLRQGQPEIGKQLQFDEVAARDNAVVNVPLSKRGNIDAQIDTFKAKQKTAENRAWFSSKQDAIKKISDDIKRLEAYVNRGYKNDGTPFTSDEQKAFNQTIMNKKADFGRLSGKKYTDLYTQATAPKVGGEAPTHNFTTDVGNQVVQTVDTAGGKRIKVLDTPTLTRDNVPLTQKQAITTGGKATIPTEPTVSSMVGKQKVDSIDPAQTKSSRGVLNYIKSKLYPTSTLPKNIEKAATQWDADIKVSQVKANRVNSDMKKVADNLKLSENDQWKLIKYAEIKDSVTASQYAKQNNIEDLVSKSKPLIDLYRSFNEEIYKRAKLAGIYQNYVENHIHQKYKQSPEEIQAILDGMTKEQAAKIAQLSPNGAGLGQRPSFSKKRKIESYKIAEALGIDPRYKTFGQIAAEMENQLQRAIANRKFMEELDKGGVISPHGKAPNDYVPLVAPGIPRTKDDLPYAASPEVAPFLETVFGGQKALTPLKALADISSTSQDISLVSPGYTFNAFTVGQAIKDITGGIGDIATGKPRQGLAKMGGTLRAFIPERDFDTKHAASIEAMARQNIGYSGSNRFQGDQSSWPQKTWNTVFNNPTFQKFMNQRRVRLFENFVKQMGDEKAAADVLKAYDGITFDLGRDKNAEAGLRAFLFAPKYREAVIGTFGNIAKGLTTELKNPAYQSSRSLGAGILITYLSMNALNQKLNDGKNMWENPPGKEMELVIPKTLIDKNANPDQFWSIPFMPGFAATPRRIGTGIASIAKGDTKEAINQFSGLTSKPISAFGQAMTNKDYFGREIVNQDSKLPDLAQRAMYVGNQLYIPNIVREPVNYIKGKQSAATAFARTMELPLKEGKFSSQFWNDYYKAKEVNQQLDDMKYRDPKKALQFYQENKSTIDQYNRMLPYAKQYGIDKGSGANSTAVTDYMAKNDTTKKDGTGFIQQANASSGVQDPEVLKLRISLKDQSLTGDEIASYYLRDVTTSSTGSKYQDAINETKVWSRLSDLNSSDSLTDDQKAQATASLLQSAGIDPQDFQYHTIAKQDNNIKTMYAIEELTKVMSNPKSTPQDAINWIKQNRYNFRGNMVLSSGVIDNLVDEGLISYADGKTLKKYSYEKDASGNLVVSGKTKASLSRSRKAKLPKPKRIKLSGVKVPKVKVVSSSGKKFEAPKIKAVSIKLKARK